MDALTSSDLASLVAPAVGPDDARREEILDAATDLFAEFGYSDAVTKDLAEKLGVGKGTIYRYFPSKRDLFLATADRVMRRLRVHIDTRIENIAAPLDRIEAGIRAFLGFFAEHPKFVELLILERALFKDRTQPTYMVHRERNKLRWNDLYRRLIAEGVLRDMPVERISTVFMDLAYGTIFTNHFAGRCRSVEDQARDILDVIFLGILGDAERPPRIAPASRRKTLIDSEALALSSGVRHAWTRFLAGCRPGAGRGLGVQQHQGRAKDAAPSRSSLHLPDDR